VKQLGRGLRRAELSTCGEMIYKSNRAIGLSLTLSETATTSKTTRGMEKWKPLRFPLLHTPDGGYLNSEVDALH
jgi:hypothetical protein